MLRAPFAVQSAGPTARSNASGRTAGGHGGARYEDAPGTASAAHQDRYP
jgi:hypothetical protein